MMPVHVGGLMIDMDAVRAARGGARLLGRRGCRPRVPGGMAAGRDSAVAALRRAHRAMSPASRSTPTRPSPPAKAAWRSTDDDALADRMRLMSLHGLSHDAWGRYSGTGSWDYQIVAPGYKYNLTDIAAAIGIHQLARAEAMRRAACSGSRVRYHAAVGGARRARPAAVAARSESTRGTCSCCGCASTGCRSTATQFIEELAGRGHRLFGALAAAAPASLLPRPARLTPADCPTRPRSSNERFPCRCSRRWPTTRSTMSATRSRRSSRNNRR